MPCSKGIARCKSATINFFSARPRLHNESSPNMDRIYFFEMPFVWAYIGHILFYHTQAGPLISFLKLLFGKFCFINIFSKYTKIFQGRLLEIQSKGELAPAPKPKKQ